MIPQKLVSLLSPLDVDPAGFFIKVDSTDRSQKGSTDSRETEEIKTDGS